MNNSFKDPIWVDSDAQLAELSALWQKLPAVALDTEFMRTTTFYPQTALIQVGDGDGVWLIDPLAISDVEPLRALLRAPQTLKVLHSCSEDLEVFSRFLGDIPDPLFDTQIAAAFCGYGHSLGYSALVEALLSVSLPKGETRSDWLARPLSDAQIEYAAQDVTYLWTVYEQLTERLVNSGRLPWLEEECARRLQQYKDAGPEDQWLRIKGGWKLNRQSLAVLRDLSLWRERQARLRDMPRNKVVPERALFDIAQRLPQASRELARIGDLTSAMQRRYGETLLEIINNASNLPDAEQPHRLPGPFSKAERQLQKRLKAVIENRAEMLGMPESLLVRKADLEQIIRTAVVGQQQQPCFDGWRQSAVGESLEAALADWRGQR